MINKKMYIINLLYSVISQYIRQFNIHMENYTRLLESKWKLTSHETRTRELVYSIIFIIHHYILYLFIYILSLLHMWKEECKGKPQKV